MTINEQYKKAIKHAKEVKRIAVNAKMNEIANYLKETETPCSARKIFKEMNEADNFANVSALALCMCKSDKLKGKRGTETRKYVEIDEEGNPVPNTVRSITKQVILYSVK